MKNLFGLGVYKDEKTDKPKRSQLHYNLQVIQIK